MKRIRLLLAVVAVMVNLTVNAWDGSAGKVYLQNVESGLYWGAGDHLNWGTRAMLVETPEYVTLSLSDGKYKLESQVSNGGTSYYFDGDYMDTGSPVLLTIESSGDYWTIANDNTYYGCNGDVSKAIKDNASGLTASSNGAKWIIRTHDEMIADLANGTIANPKDATFLFLDPGFGRNNRNRDYWTVTNCTNLNIKGVEEYNNNKGTNNYGCGESYHSTFTISQTATVPNGVYKVSGRAFYRQDGSDNTNLPYLEANGQKSNFPLRTGSEASMYGAQQSFANGSYPIDPMIVEVTDGSLTIKMVCEQTGLWCILDGFELAYYGPITLADLPLDEAYVNSYNTALNAAKAYQSQDMFDADKTALNEAILNNEFDTSTKKQGELESVQTAISALNAATAAAAEAVAQYTIYTNAVTAIADNQTDLTSILRNPDFEVNPVQYQLVDGGWTNEGVGIQYQNNTGFDGYKSNTWFAERWVASGQIGAFKTYQNLTLPAGIYELSVVATFNGAGATMFVGDDTTPITDPKTYKLLFRTNDKEQVTFGLQAIAPTGSWLKADNFQLTYIGEDFPAYTLVTGNMSSAASTAQNDAETTFNNDKTVANYNALLAAITAAQTSKDAYAKAATSIADAKTLGTNFNFATVAATTTFTEGVAAVETAYNNGSLTDASANNGANLGTLVVGWHAARSSENFTIAEAYMQSAWTGGELNDWSTEGDSDGSNFHVPFFQNWIADANSLAEGTTSGQLTGLDNGLYRVSALVRVRIKDGQESGTVPSGITLAVNNGEAVNACAGSQVDETQFYLGTITAEGFVYDGTLNAVFTRSAENNISWLSFKDIKYIKVRDLTDEEKVSAAKEGLLQAINNANEVKETYKDNVGTRVFQIPVSQLTALDGAIASAQSIYENDEAILSDITIATNMLNNTIVPGFQNATLNKPEDGKRYYIKIAQDGFAKDGNSIRLSYNENSKYSGNYRNNPNGFVFLADNSSKVHLTQAVIFTQVNGNTYNITFENTGGQVYLTYGSKANSQMNWKDSQIEGVTDANFKGEFKIVATPSSNVFKIYNTITNTPITCSATTPGGSGTHRYTDIYTNEDGSASTFTIAEASQASVPVSAKAGKFGTIIFPFTPNVTEGFDDIKFYQFASSDNDGVRVNEVEKTSLVANMPYLVKNTGSENFSKTLTGWGIAAQDSYNSSEDDVHLTGVYTDANVPENSYVLQDQGQGQKFYKVNGTFPATPYRVFLVDNSGNEARFFNLFIEGEGVTNGIDRLTGITEQVTGVIYDLQGRKVQKPGRGMYIINGKKVVIK